MISIKDWISLVASVMCSGLAVFFLQKAFERRQLAKIEKYKYVLIMQEKVDIALERFIKVVQSKESVEQINYINEFIISYCNVYYYYQQNQRVFKSLNEVMERIINIHEHLRGYIDSAKEISHIEIEKSLRDIYELLQFIQEKCILHKI